MTQFVRCVFGSDGKGRPYTYANDGVRLEGGERVLVDRNGNSIPVTVTDVDVEQPKDKDGEPIECKPILGFAPAKEETAPADA